MVTAFKTNTKINLEKMDVRELEELQMRIEAELIWRKSDQKPEHDFRRYIKYAIENCELTLKDIR